MKKKKPILFYISAGHGGYDPGAVAAGMVKESAIALVTAKATAEYLQRKKCNVRMARTKDVNRSITSKTNEINQLRTKYRVVALDIHYNAGGGDGAEVFVSGLETTVKAKIGVILGKHILREFKEIGQNSRGIKFRLSGKTDYFGFIRQSKGPAIIVECGFLDNRRDRKLFDTKREQQAVGKAIGRACYRYYRDNR